MHGESALVDITSENIQSELRKKEELLGSYDPADIMNFDETANTASKLQALDAGIIDNFKANFRAQQYDRALCLYISKKLNNPNVYKMDQAQAMVFLANERLKVKPETINGMLPGLPRNFDNKVTDVSQLNLEADESEMIVCYTTSTTNNEETAEGNIDETEENDNTEQDEQRVDIVEFPLDDLDRKLHCRIRMRLADSCAELNKAKSKQIFDLILQRLIENEIAKIETTAQIENNVSLCINNHPEATNSHGKQYTPVRSEKEGISCYKERENVDAYEEESNITANDEVEEHNVEFESMFKKLDPAKKWYLSTGKCMDDELFMFDLQCESDHPSRSLIADPYDKNYILYNYNQDSTAKLRAALGKNHAFHADYNKDEGIDKDWINLVVFSLVREYENGNMDRPHNEQWYQSHIWSMIEACFDKLEDIEAVGGESACLGSKKRKNEKRSIDAITKMPRLRYGHKCDLIFRQYDNQHTAPLEFGASEAKSRIEDESGTNFMNEGFYKLPRILKDMLDCLLKEINFDHRSEAIRTVWLHPFWIVKSKALEISNSVTKFGSTVLPVILSTWVCSEIVKEVFEIISSNNEANENDVAWLDDCLERNSLPNMPTASASSETAQKKLKPKD
ncbi:hypothetical protein G6F46_009446 [Rhizopus delemar]|nr:hypothetical protein G6F49_010252 [Rhizopus delemar]KAG1580411.1 hypothetical protein G6F48_010474 [Rhizopus delemar]KAG1589263.1 hypothetical protein G6F47_010400 [Rhizopus delemar]KAG1611187.1 hypothetical protein G6F46_009446 [Rhizopus delemar]